MDLRRLKYFVTVVGIRLIFQSRRSSLYIATTIKPADPGAGE